MNNPIGYGVFGTFGAPYGYQQIIYSGLDINESLELDEAAIECYPGAELFAVKRILTDDVYTICFCTYSYVKEAHNERLATFVGSCITLRDTYAEAEYIYKVLRAMHEGIMHNEVNIVDGTLQVMQVPDIVVSEPSELVALRANAVPINKTPFAYAALDDAGQYLVIPDEHLSGNKEDQVIAFFEHALKYHGDTGTLYFSFDANVTEFVTRADIIGIKDWNSFVNHRPIVQPPEAKDTIKDAQKLSDRDIAIERNRYIVASSDTPNSTSHKTDRDGYTDADAKNVVLNTEDASNRRFDDDRFDDDDDKIEEDDPYKPFDLWEEPIPPGGWEQDEARRRMKEYNRLFKYTNTLLEHINEPNSRRLRKKINERNNTQKAAGKPPGKSRKTLLILLCLVIAGSIIAYFLSDDRNSNPVVAAPVASQEVVEDEFKYNYGDTLPTAFLQPSATGNQDPVAQFVLVPIGKPLSEKPATAQSAANSLSSGLGPVTADFYLSKDIPDFIKTKGLHPAPNIEMTQTEVAMLRQNGTKNRTLQQIAKTLYDNIPSNIGNVYKGQETEYAAALLNGNREAFRKSGIHYICIADNAITHIPAYKSPHLPVVSPK